MRSSTLVAVAAADAERRLKEMRSARDAVTTNLLDLEADPTYSLLKAGDGLSGATAAKAKPALARVEELWRGLQLLDALIDEADVIRGTGKIDPISAKRLLEMMNGESIALPAQAVPLAQRSLTGATVVGRSVTPNALLEGMEEAFNALRDVIAEVQAAWDDLLPRAERAMAEADRLNALVPGHRGIADVRLKMRTLSGRLTDDPLGAAADMARAEASLAAVDQAVKDRAATQQQLVERFRLARTDLDELVRLIDAGRTALGRCRDEIAGPVGLYEPLDPAVLTGDRGLEPWLGRLQGLLDSGEIGKAARGYESWRRLADQTLATARKVADANARATRRRHELRGLMRAAQAKAGGLGRAEDSAVTELARRAREALTTPCDLAAAESAVEAYLAELRRQGGRTI